MIAEPAPNTITRPYRGLSVQEVDIPLTPAAIGELLRSREIYRRTAFLVLRNGDQTALVAVRPADPGPLFSPVAELRVLSGPETTVWITDPATDVGNASSLAAAALRHQRDGVLAYVVQGKFEHVNFIWRPAPVRIRVTEVIPPASAETAGHGRAGGRLRRGPAPGRPGPGRGGRARAGGGAPGPALPAAVPGQRRARRAATSASWTPTRPTTRTGC